MYVWSLLCYLRYHGNMITAEFWNRMTCTLVLQQLLTSHHFYEENIEKRMCTNVECVPKNPVLVSYYLSCFCVFSAQVLWVNPLRLSIKTSGLTSFKRHTFAKEPKSGCLLETSGRNQWNYRTHPVYDNLLQLSICYCDIICPCILCWIKSSSTPLNAAIQTIVYNLIYRKS